MATVLLTADDFAVCLHLAQERAIESLRNNRKDALFDKDWISAHAIHVLGAVGEIAFAKWLGVYPAFSVRQFSGMMADVETVIKYEVRHRRQITHDLILRDNDPKDRVYVLTRGAPPAIEIAGWTWGSEFIGHSEYGADWGSHGGAYFVNVELLHPMDTLPRG